MANAKQFGDVDVETIPVKLQYDADNLWGTKSIQMILLPATHLILS